MENLLGRVVAVLEQSNTRWALVGAHAVGLLVEPRATADVDFVVDDRNLRGILRALEQEFGQLEVHDLGPALRLEQLDVDLIRASNHPLFGEVLDHTRLVGQWRVPVPEALMAMKFLSAISPWRAQDKKLHDLGDLVALYRAVGDELEHPLLVKLAGLAYPGAEKELQKLLRRIDQGEPLQI